VRYLLDTDTVSRLFCQSDDVLADRFLAVSHEVCISIVTAEEMLRGAIAVIRTEETQGRRLAGYGRLESLLSFLHPFSIISFDEDTQAIYDAMPASVRRIGAGDCKIASVALKHNLIVVTFNGTHFDRIPGVQWQDYL
jgi:tRNA(fMet)-specific endonuclease VapC